MPGWDELRATLTDLRDTQPGVLQGFPGLDGVDTRPPWRVGLAAPQAELAASLHLRFGSDLHLTVGALPYPMPDADPRVVELPSPSLELLDPDQVGAELDGPVTVASGQSTPHGLVLTNVTDSHLTVLTNGRLTALIVDLDTGATVGGSAGPQRMPLILFRASPHDSVRIPLLIGTASFTSTLGYVVPPGQWGVRTDVRLQLGHDESLERTTRTFPITVAG